MQVTRTTTTGNVTIPAGAAVILKNGMAQVILNVPADQVAHLVRPVAESEAAPPDSALHPVS